MLHARFIVSHCSRDTNVTGYLLGYLLLLLQLLLLLPLLLLRPFVFCLFPSSSLGGRERRSGRELGLVVVTFELVGWLAETDWPYNKNMRLQRLIACIE